MKEKEIKKQNDKIIHEKSKAQTANYNKEN